MALTYQQRIDKVWAAVEAAEAEMRTAKIQEVKVKIEPPKVQQVTAQSNPKVWAMLQPPKKDTLQTATIKQWIRGNNLSIGD